MKTIVISRKINRELRNLEKYKTNHLFHLVLSVVTAGIWVPAWLVFTISNANERHKAEKRLERLELALSGE